MIQRHHSHVALIDPSTPLETHGPEDSRFALAFGACDEGSVAEVWGDLHDKLVAANPTRFGPVQGGWYRSDLTREQLAGILSENDPAAAAHMLDWIQSNPGTVLVVAMVEVPGA